MVKNNRSGQDWDHFEKFMGAQLPFMPKDFLKGRMKNGGDWIGDYVQEVLKRSFSRSGAADVGTDEEEAAASAVSSSDLDYDYETFETHTSVIVRVQVPDGVHIKNIRLYAGSAQLKLEQDPTRKKLYIRLPHPVDHGASKATYKNRVLEVRLPKLEEAEMFQEIRIRPL